VANKYKIAQPNPIDYVCDRLIEDGDGDCRVLVELMLTEKRKSDTVIPLDQCPDLPQSGEFGLVKLCENRNLSSEHNCFCFEEKLPCCKLNWKCLQLNSTLLHYWIGSRNRDRWRENHAQWSLRHFASLQFIFMVQREFGEFPRQPVTSSMHGHKMLRLL